MRHLLLLLPFILHAAPPRYARLGEFQGTVDVQLTAADPWIPAERNLPLMESTWLRTGPGSRLEIELDEGNAYRLGPDSQVELSDYKQLSTGQRITLLRLDRGTAYFTGIAEGNDAVVMAVRGAQVTVTRGTRLRFEVQEQWSQIAVIEGVVRFSSPAAEMDLREGQTTRIEPANPARFFLNREVAAMELDRWSEDRDKALSSSTSAMQVLQRYGLVDLDAAGEWIQTEDLGPVWKPKTTEGWQPFQKGRWRWYDTLGYTWVSDEPWGWLPYHYGRWQRRENVGWIWAPSKSSVFKPGEVYWLRGARFAGWGPLAPNEVVPAPDAAHPQQYLAANTVWAAFTFDAPVIDPDGFTGAPKDPLAAAVFAVALPSPAFRASKLDAVRPFVRAGRGRVIPVAEGVTFTGTSVPPPAPPAPTVVITEPPAPAPPPPTADVIYPPPVFVPLPNILIVNAPGNPDYSSRPKTRPGSSSPPSQTKTQPPSTPVSTIPTASGRTIATPPKSVPIPEISAPAPTRREHPPVDPSRSPAPPPVLSPRPVPRGEGPSGERERIPSVQREKKFRDSGESQILNEVVKNVTGQNYTLALTALDSWSRSYRKSDFNDDRAYYYMQAYTGLNQPAKVVEAGTPLLAKNLGTSFQDPMQIIGVLYLASLNLQKLQHPTREQLVNGKIAAQELLQYLPLCFTPQNKPSTVTSADWNKARTDLEILARQTIAFAEHR